MDGTDLDCLQNEIYRINIPVMDHHAQEKVCQCQHCEYKAVQKSDLKKSHIMTRHTYEKPHKCPHCEYKSVEVCKLKKHIMARHTDEKPHQCPHCEYNSVRKGSLNRHIMARHTYEKPHQCPHYEYKSALVNSLKQHIMARHTDEKPHHCPHCGYKAVQKGVLKNHIMARHTDEKPHQCPHSRRDYICRTLNNATKLGEKCHVGNETIWEKIKRLWLDEHIGIDRTFARYMLMVKILREYECQGEVNVENRPTGKQEETHTPDAQLNDLQIDTFTWRGYKWITMITIFSKAAIAHQVQD
ncbi:zinc finger Y-chromosomal protein-like [Halyomorpha halys]|uniref:zinc finger Y-chromosomal protein-like n=1 Tax=Halyomorpha halys TaxID=286706 RepID=UPI0034D1FB18